MINNYLTMRLESGKYMPISNALIIESDKTGYDYLTIQRTKFVRVVGKNSTVEFMFSHVKRQEHNNEVLLYIFKSNYIYGGPLEDKAWTQKILDMILIIPLKLID